MGLAQLCGRVQSRDHMWDVGSPKATENLLYSSQPPRTAFLTFSVTTSRVNPDIMVLHLAGRIAIGAETYELEWLVRDLLSQGERKLIFHLADVRQIDADAALFLVRCFFTVRGTGGELRFAGASARVGRPFRTTMLDTLLPFDPTVTAACECFRGKAATGG